MSCVLLLRVTYAWNHVKQTWNLYVNWKNAHIEYLQDYFSLRICSYRNVENRRWFPGWASWFAIHKCFDFFNFSGVFFVEYSDFFFLKTVSFFSKFWFVLVKWNHLNCSLALPDILICTFVETDDWTLLAKMLPRLLLLMNFLCSPENFAIFLAFCYFFKSNFTISIVSRRKPNLKQQNGLSCIPHYDI